MKQQLPLLYRGMSGKLGNKVYSVLKNGHTYAKAAPGSYNLIPTSQQAVVREHFREAHLFAKSVIADPVLKAQYAAKAKPGSNAYVTAVSEYMRGYKKEAVEVAGLRCAPCIGIRLKG